MKTDRRHFMGPIAGVAAVASTSFGASESAMPKVELPGCGIKMSRLGLGTGTVGGLTKQSVWAKRNAKKKATMSSVEAEQLFLKSYERGITFFDLAEAYGTHGFCREALKKVPREKVALMTKFWWRTQSQTPEKLSVREREQFARDAFERYLRELDTDYIDMLLLHLLEEPSWTEEMKPYMEVFSAYKERGLIKTLGCSCHSYGAMETAATSAWVDVLLARINPAGIRCDGDAEEVLEVLRRAKDRGAFVIGMKIYGAGMLVPDRDACMKFAQECGVLDALTLGMSSVEQLNENLSLFSKYPAA